MKSKWVKQKGFTIVELLIVIVVIGILAAITIVAYNGIQLRANENRARADMAAISKAIQLARVNTGKTLYGITGSGGTAYECIVKANGTDLAALAQSDLCWVRYKSAITAIANASGAQVQNIVDPWGRPYHIDENEGDGGSCNRDILGIYTRPFVSGWGMYTGVPELNIPLSGNTGCA